MNLSCLFVACFLLTGVTGDGCGGRWEILTEHSNYGYSPYLMEYTIRTGTSSSVSDTRGQSSSNTRSQDSETSSSSGVEGGLNLGFGGIGASGSASSTSGSSSRSGSSSTSDSRQEATKTASQDSGTEKKSTYNCPARSKCWVEQCVIISGNRKTLTAMTQNKQSIIEDPTEAGVPTTPKPIQIERQGETWILARNVTFAAELTGGNWESAESCAPSSFVNSFRFKSGKQGSGLARFAVNCSTRTDDSDFISIKELQSGYGGAGDTPWVQPFRSSYPTSYATGFVFQTWNRKEGNKKFRGNWKLMFKDEVDYLFLPKDARNVETSYTKCPEGQAVCGLMTLLDTKTQSVVTNVGLKCCYYCIPRQEFVNVNTFKNDNPNDVDVNYELTKGMRKESTKTSGGTKADDESSTTEGRHRAGVQAGFAATFGATSRTEFNWASTEQFVSSEETKESFSFKCGPMSKCVVEQLVGVCGEFRIKTPHTSIVSRPLEQPTTEKVERSNLVDEEEYGDEE